MAPLSQDLVGRDVYARDDVKVGQEDSRGRLMIHLTSSYLDNAPRSDTRPAPAPVGAQLRQAHRRAAPALTTVWHCPWWS